MRYTTIQGQTWDQIAREVYGDELRADVLMQANPEYVDTFVFSAGVELTPAIKKEAGNLPPWRS